ncbi:MAG TPA: hypothetical protein VF136_03735 [Methylomirabilota bacterium]
MPRVAVVVLVLVAAVVGAVFPATAQLPSGNVLTTEGYALPRDHQYERYDAATGTYNRVDVTQVPALIQQKAWIYDRTAQAWVFHPQKGLNAAYSGQASGGAIAAGGLSLPPDHQYERYDPAGGSYSRVDVAQVPALVDQKAWIYDRTAQAWVYRPQQGLDPRYASSANAGRWSGRGQGGDGQQGERVTGVVQSIQGNQMTLRTDDNRAIVVDLSRARQRSATRLTVGERVSAIGFYTAPNRLTAQTVRSGQAQSRADGREQIHGVVQSVQGSTMRFRSDDGRLLTVDMSEVGDRIRTGLGQGERVTVIGDEWTGPDQLRAEHIVPDRSPSALPR